MHCALFISFILEYWLANYNDFVLDMHEFAYICISLVPGVFGYGLWQCIWQMLDVNIKDLSYIPQAPSQGDNPWFLTEVWLWV